MIDVDYGFTRNFPGVPPKKARERITAALAAEGFGILTEIDVKKTLEQKLGVEFRPYTILGACNPSIAHRALCAEPGLGLLLPCNVVLVEDDAGGTVVSIADPGAMLKLAGDMPALVPLMEEARTRLRRALEAA